MAHLWIVMNIDGNVTADEDVNAAIARMKEQYGGDDFDVQSIEVFPTRNLTDLSSILVRPEIDDDRFIHKA